LWCWMRRAGMGDLWWADLGPAAGSCIDPRQVRGATRPGGVVALGAARRDGRPVVGRSRTSGWILRRTRVGERGRSEGASWCRTPAGTGDPWWADLGRWLGPASIRARPGATLGRWVRGRWDGAPAAGANRRLDPAPSPVVGCTRSRVGMEIPRQRPRLRGTPAELRARSRLVWAVDVPPGRGGPSRWRSPGDARHVPGLLTVRPRRQSFSPARARSERGTTTRRHVAGPLYVLHDPRWHHDPRGTRDGRSLQHRGPSHVLPAVRPGQADKPTERSPGGCFT
jgi:hypothetical protein